ncbi:MAG: polysaccharide biosynthesis C-terminal domain-containing protein [Planctomycetales bacterium]|nr:polysaccharide biosynthesis C-terminal domain-containing protein [Planctomycetales bacterium]
MWCTERTRLTAIPWAAGLGLNVVLNLALLPVWGLYGAVFATAVSTLTCVVAVLALGRAHGLQLNGGVAYALALPFALSGGPALAAAALVATVGLAFRSDRLLTTHEREQLASLAAICRQRAQAALGPSFRRRFAAS